MTKSISVNMPAFTIEASENGNVVKTISTCSFGRDGHRTPIIQNGSLSDERQRMHYSHAYGNAPMPFSLFFAEGCAFHAGNPQVASHGCIHLAPADAEWLFNWAAKDPVQLHMAGPYPIPPVKPSASADAVVA